MKTLIFQNCNENIARISALVYKSFRAEIFTIFLLQFWKINVLTNLFWDYVTFRLSQLLRQMLWKWVQKKTYSNSRPFHCQISLFYQTSNVPNFCCNDELSLMMSWVGCKLTDLELLILFAENSQILLKISVIPILLTFMYLVALNLVVNNQLHSSLNSTHHRTQLIISAHDCQMCFF